MDNSRNDETDAEKRQIRRQRQEHRATARQGHQTKWSTQRAKAKSERRQRNQQER